MENIKYLMALKAVKGLGDGLINLLLSHFKDPRMIFEASGDQLSKVVGVGNKIITSVQNFDEWDLINTELENVGKNNCSIVTIYSEHYPKNLKQCYNPPPYLYMYGDLEDKDQLSISIVGTRSADNYGRQVAKYISSELAKKGITLISGFARGIDTIVHKTALEYSGRTIAVLGSGLDVIYPPENKRIYENISVNGAVLSDYPLGTFPESSNFPKRNRIISGLSKGVVVIQASHKSGSLITANLALEQNREVFSVPGNINNHLCKGSNELIKKGAKIVLSADDILEEIADMKSFIQQDNSPDDKVEYLDNDEKKIYDSLLNNSLHIDEIIKITGFGSSKVSAILLKMELDGLIEQASGKMFHLKMDKH